MNKELDTLKDLKSAFVSHCKTLGCEENYIKVCENKFSDIEKELIEKETLQMHYAILESLYKDLLLENGALKKIFKAIVIIDKKGLNTNELWYIKHNYLWDTYVESMKELYWGDEDLDKILKTQEEYDLLKEVLNNVE